MADETPTPDPQDAPLRPAPLPSSSGGFVTHPLLTPDETGGDGATESSSDADAPVEEMTADAPLAPESPIEEITDVFEEVTPMHAATDDTATDDTATDDTATDDTATDDTATDDTATDDTATDDTATDDTATDDTATDDTATDDTATDDTATDDTATDDTATDDTATDDTATDDTATDDTATDDTATDDTATDDTATDDTATDDTATDDTATDEAPEASGDTAIEDITSAYDDASPVDKLDAAGSGPEGDLEITPVGPEDFDPEELRAVLRMMMTSRKLDDKMLTLLKQGKGFFHIGSMGHEAAQLGLAKHLKGGHDWFCMYYRDLTTSLQVGMTPADVMRAHFAKRDDVFGGGRQMPEHFGHRGLNIMTTSSSVGAQFVPAVGFGLAVARDGDNGDGEKRVVYVSGGDGSTSQGSFHEALNWAARESLPVLFHVQDNGYAISVPVAEQTASGSIWPVLGGYPGLARMRYDGTDFFESYAVAEAAVAHARAGKGPVALHADVVRLLPHSSSDDHKKYRTAESIEADLKRDPIASLSARLIEAGILTDDEVEVLRADVAREIDALAKQIEAEPDPDPAEATTHVYFEGEDTRTYEASGDAGDLVVMVDAINHAMDEEMARDERVLVYGEDVGGGKGGVFTATRGLTAKYGDRCFNSPLAEHSVIGSAVGLAAAGYKPVVEIQFADYIWPAMQPLRNQVSSFRYRSRGEWSCPMVIRVPAGGYIHGGLCHSQNIEAIFGHFPGLHVVMPSNAADAKGLLKSAIRGEDPVLFLEHKALYRQGPARRPEPHSEYLVPLGKAAVTREGSDLTIVTWGAIVYKAINIAKALEKEGVSVEIIDVRSFLPFDSETILASAKKTGRVLVAYEDHEFMGFGAEIAAQVADAAFPYLDAPVKRIAGTFSPIPYADVLEKVVLPQDDDVMAAARAVLAY